MFLLASLFAFFSNLLKTWDEVRQRRFRRGGGDTSPTSGSGRCSPASSSPRRMTAPRRVTLALNQSRQVMGYTLTFKGVDKPTPTAGRRCSSGQG